MKRELIQNVKAIPYTSGEAIDRAGFLSAVCAVKAASDGAMKVAVTHLTPPMGPSRPSRMPACSWAAGLRLPT